jgi:hypothetical protein
VQCVKDRERGRLSQLNAFSRGLEVLLVIVVIIRNKEVLEYDETPKSDGQ